MKRVRYIMSNITIGIDKKFKTQALPIIKVKAKERNVTPAAIIRKIIIDKLRYTEGYHTNIWLAANAREEMEWCKKHKSSILITMDDKMVEMLQASTNDRYELTNLVRYMVYDALEIPR